MPALHHSQPYEKREPIQEAAAVSLCRYSRAGRPHRPSMKLSEQANCNLLHCTEETLFLLFAALRRSRLFILVGLLLGLASFSTFFLVGSVSSLASFRVVVVAFKKVD
jgi:hypothetical protein